MSNFNIPQFFSWPHVNIDENAILDLLNFCRLFVNVNVRLWRLEERKDDPNMEGIVSFPGLVVYICLYIDTWNPKAHQFKMNV